MEALDWVMIAVYFLLLLGVAWWVVRRNRDTADDYFLAGRNLSWWIVGASIFASNIGSEHVVGLAGSGAKDGVAMAHYELHAWCLLMLAWVFVPFYARSMVFTMPEFLERRFSVGSRYVLSIVSLITFVVSKIAVGIFAGGIVFSVLLPELEITIGAAVIDSFWIGSVLVIVLTGLYTILGGMRAVAYNDAVQTVILIAGSGLLTIYGLMYLDGWTALRELCGSDKFNLWKPLIPPGVEATWEPVLEAKRQAWYFNSNFPWLGMAICAPVIGLWYWCTDQYIVQRALGAPNEQTARRGSIFAAFLKLFPVYLFIIPGLICFAVAESTAKRLADGQEVEPEVRGLSEALLKKTDRSSEGAQIEKLKDGSQIERWSDGAQIVRLSDGTALELTGDGTQRAFPLMVKHLLPTGLRGIVVAGLLSALMGSLAGVFNACSTLFTVDLYQKIRPAATQHQIVRTGRIATAVMVAIALAWIPVVKNAHSLYEYLQQIQGYLAPPIFVVFFFGVFFKRLNAQGCFWAMVVGFIVGVFRMLVDTPVTLGLKHFPAVIQVLYEPGSFLWIVNKINFQYFSVLITIISAIVMVVVSYMSSQPDYATIGGLTYGTASAEDKRRTRASWDRRDVLASAFVLAAILGAYLYFRG